MPAETALTTETLPGLLIEGNRITRGTISKQGLSYLKNEFMKFLGKWMDLEGIILSEVTQSKELAQYVLTDKWILAQKLRIPKI